MRDWRCNANVYSRFSWEIDCLKTHVTFIFSLRQFSFPNYNFICADSQETFLKCKIMHIGVQGSDSLNLTPGLHPFLVLPVFCSSSWGLDFWICFGVSFCGSICLALDPARKADDCWVRLEFVEESLSRRGFSLRGATSSWEYGRKPPGNHLKSIKIFLEYTANFFYLGILAHLMGNPLD